jgi:outer membrane protein OmpA-like peptidoglycan-associated protein
MSLSSDTEWQNVDAMGDPWSPADFAGEFWMAAQYWGMSLFDAEQYVEEPVNWVREQLGWGPVRASGEYNYTQFIAEDRADLWVLSRDFTNSFGLHAEYGGGVTAGYLWLEGDEPDPTVLVPADVGRQPRTSAAVSFEVGRSELTTAGATLLRDAAAAHLHQLSSPSTAIEVVGHASAGDARPLYNLILSQRRAANVVRALRAYLGPLYAVRPERTWVLGLGDQQASEDGGPDANWRRVDVFINGAHAIQFAAAAP